MLFPALFVAALVATAIAGTLPSAVAGLYLVASVVTFIAYLADKSAARKNQWRIRERNLHVLALLGGWPGALMAQHLLRHKSGKPPFQRRFRLTIVLNCAVLAVGWYLVLQPA